jgi:hypothetical protein
VCLVLTFANHTRRDKMRMSETEPGDSEARMTLRAASDAISGSKELKQLINSSAVLNLKFL